VAGSKAVEHLLECFARLPGIGPKTSERLTYHLLRSAPNQAIELADAIRKARESTRICSVCFNLDQTDPCSICEDGERDRSILLVVEDPREVASFDAAEYRGLFHVLQGRVSGLEGIGPDDLTIDRLVQRAADPEVGEVCLATNPDLEGEATARLIAERLVAVDVEVTRLARGMPAGAHITQVSQSILADALEGRRPLR
jgi:recombination protein RecR